LDHVAKTVAEIKDLSDNELRGRVFSTGRKRQEHRAPYPYQTKALDRIEHGMSVSPPISGILHYPTGAGKTRVGLEVIARALAADPTHRFVWSTHTKNLIRQSMVLTNGGTISISANR
jgi:superfamily II DNA or RNA helicase